MTVQDMVNQFDQTKLSTATRFLKEGKMTSINFVQDPLDGNEFEGCAENNEDPFLLIPGVEVDASMNVLDLHCQCVSQTDMCIHEAALLVGVNWMIQTECFDLQQAMKILGMKKELPNKQTEYLH